MVLGVRIGWPSVLMPDLATMLQVLVDVASALKEALVNGCLVLLVRMVKPVVVMASA